MKPISLIFFLTLSVQTACAQPVPSSVGKNNASVPVQDCSNWLYSPSQGSFVRIGDLDITGDQMTVEAEINMTVPFTGGPSIGSDIVGKYRDPTDVNYLLRAQNAQITTTNGFFKTPDICPLSLNKTYHVAMVYDGTSLKYYKNGFLMNQVPATGNLVLNNWKTEIGFYEPEIYNTTFIGYINEVRIWKIARTQTELQAFMSSSLPSPATQTGLLAYFTFDNLTNKQGNTLWDGVLHGAAVINQTNPTCASFVPDNVCCPVFAGSLSGNSACSGKLGMLTFHSSGASVTAGYTLVYSVGTTEYTVSGIADGASFPPAVVPTGTTTYTLKSIGDGIACVSSANSQTTITVTNCCPQLSGTLTGNAVCAGADAMLTFHSSLAVGPTFTLTYSDGTNTFVNSGVQSDIPFGPASVPGTTTTYTLQSILDETSGCTSTVNGTTGTVTILQSPTKDFSMFYDRCLGTDRTFMINQGSPDALIWHLSGASIPDQDIPSQGSLSTTFPSTGYYTVKMTVQNVACPYSVTKTIYIGSDANDYILNSDTLICFGDSVKLRTDKGADFCWAPYELVDSPYASPAWAKPESSTTFFGNAVIYGENLALNSSFSNGNAGFSSDEMAATGGANPGTYTVTAAPTGWNASFSSCGDHTTGTGKMLVINPALSGGRTVWAADVNVTPNTNYVFYFWNQLLKQDNPAKFAFAINGVVFSDDLRSSGGLCSWYRIDFLWNSGPLTQAKISIINATPSSQVQGGFAIDDIFFGPVQWIQDKVQIDIDNLAIVASDNITVCKGALVPLSATGALNYAWLPGKGLNNPASGTPIDTANQSQMFYVTGTDATGCRAKDSVTVSLYPKVKIDHTPNSEICPDVPKTLTASGGTAFSWSPAAYLDDPLSPNPVATLDATTRFYVTMTDANGCQESDSLLLSIRKKPLFHAPEDQVICRGGTAVLSSANDPADIFTWSPASFLDNAAGAAPKATPEAPIVYDLHISDPVCVAYDSSFLVSVDVKPGPSLVATKSNDIDCATLSAQLTVVGGTGYTWSPATGLNNPLLANPVALLDTTTTFTVQGSSENGCIGFDTVTVIVKNQGKVALSMPNAFTPNGDGLNDCYGIKKWGPVNLTEFSIFNRWGQRVFMTTNNNGCWDGTFHGEKQDAGQFIYVIRGTTFCGPFTRTGPFILIR